MSNLITAEPWESGILHSNYLWFSALHSTSTQTDEYFLRNLSVWNILTLKINLLFYSGVLRKELSNWKDDQLRKPLTYEESRLFFYFRKNKLLER